MDSLDDLEFTIWFSFSSLLLCFISIQGDREVSISVMVGTVSTFATQ